MCVNSLTVCYPCVTCAAKRTETLPRLLLFVLDFLNDIFYLVFLFVCFIYFVKLKKYCSKVCSDSKDIYNVTNISK